MIHTPALIQGVYYLVTGLWPLVHMQSFEQLTGPKTDHWLVRTIGLLFASIGIVLLVDQDDTAALLGVLAAASTAAIDLWYGIKGTISKMYIADAALEVGFIAWWLLS